MSLSPYGTTPAIRRVNNKQGDSETDASKVRGDSMEMAIARLDGKGRVVIPKRIRERIGIKENSAVFVYACESLVFLRKVDMDKESVLESIRRLRE